MRDEYIGLNQHLWEHGTRKDLVDGFCRKCKDGLYETVTHLLVLHVSSYHCFSNIAFFTSALDFRLLAICLQHFSSPTSHTNIARQIPTP